MAKSQIAKNTGSDTPYDATAPGYQTKIPGCDPPVPRGDFYETFGQDAVLASQILGITLTKRNNGAAASSDLAGFPHHALDTYLHKLVKAGHRVAICDQLEDPRLAKGIVKRGVTDMVTPGTTVNDKLLEHHSNNFLAAIHFAEHEQYGLAFLDISTGEFLVAEGDREYADKLLQSFKPAEVVFQRHQQKKFKEYFTSKIYTYTLDEWIFDSVYAEEVLLKHFQTHSFKGFGVDDLKNGLIAAGAILHYLKETEHPNLQHIFSLQRIDRDDFLWMDRFTIRNLELVIGNSEGNHTLLSVLDNTVSPMGARLLKRWIVFPLKDIQKINERLDTVEFFIKETDLRNKLGQHIKQCGDIERLVAKIPVKKINPREVLQLARGLRQVHSIKQLCLASSNEYLKRLGDALNPCPYIADKIFKEIVDNPPALAVKGGMMNRGVNDELDELRKIAHSGKEYLAELQMKEAERTGISSLKIGFNNVFGYYLEGHQFP
jgi:DNA mismatch repair protein MutS